MLEGEEIKIRIKMKRGTQKSEMHPSSLGQMRRGIADSRRETRMKSAFA
jgi:hypothetical protein